MFVDVLRSKIFLTLVDATSKQYDDQVWTLKDVKTVYVLAHEVLARTRLMFERNEVSTP